MTFSVEQVRADFPVLNREVNGQPLVYLDSAASAQKPEVVIGAEGSGVRPRHHRGYQPGGQQLGKRQRRRRG